MGFSPEWSVSLNSFPHGPSRVVKELVSFLGNMLQWATLLGSVFFGTLGGVYALFGLFGASGRREHTKLWGGALWPTVESAPHNFACSPATVRAWPTGDVSSVSITSITIDRL